MKLLAAFLVLLGTSGQGFAAMLCGTPMCPKTLAAKPEPVAKKSCCKKEKAHQAASKPAKQDQEKGGKNCCCEVKSGPTPAKFESKLALPVGLHVDLAPAESAPVMSVSVAVVAASRITSYSDASPPEPGVLPDRGRAPPAA